MQENRKDTKREKWARVIGIYELINIVGGNALKFTESHCRLINLLAFFPLLSSFSPLSNVVNGTFLIFIYLFIKHLSLTHTLSLSLSLSCSFQQHAMTHIGEGRPTIINQNLSAINQLSLTLPRTHTHILLLVEVNRAESRSEKREYLICLRC